MAFQQIPFASMPSLPARAPRRSPFGTLSKSFIEGMKIANMKAEMQRKAESEDAANALNKLKAQYYPQQMQSQMGLREAQMEAAQQGAAQKKLVMGLLRDQLSGGQPSNGEAPSAPSVSGAGGVAGGPADLKQALMRKMMNLPAETPNEMQNRRMDTFRQQQDLKVLSPTAPTQARWERLEEVGESLVENLEKLPKQLHALGTSSPGFSKRLKSIGESFAVAKNFPKGLGSLERATDIISPTGVERFDPARYSKRLEGELRELAPALAHAYRRKGKPIPASLEKYLRIRKGKETEGRSNFHPVVGPNGKVYMVPYGEVNQSLSQGGIDAF